MASSVWNNKKQTKKTSLIKSFSTQVHYVNTSLCSDSGESHTQLKQHSGSHTHAENAPSSLTAHPTNMTLRSILMVSLYNIVLLNNQNQHRPLDENITLDEKIKMDTNITGSASWNKVVFSIKYRITHCFMSRKSLFILLFLYFFL